MKVGAYLAGALGSGQQVALDVTIQAQILALLQDLREATGLSIMFVTHDLGVVGQICDELAVMYAGRIVETGPVSAVLETPRHPYTAALQDPYSSLNPRLTVRQMLRELLTVHKLVPRADVEGRCRELMSLVGLPAAALDGLPSQFSGGQRQRIAIARALAVEPAVLIADEPVSSLDVSVQATILRLFAELRDQLGLTMVIISHNLAVVRHLSDQVAVMYPGRVVEEGTRDELFASVRHPYARALAAAPRLRQRGLARPDVRGEPPSPVDLPAGCRFHPRCPQAADICRTDSPALLPVRPGSSHIVGCHFGADPGPAEIQAR